MSTIIESRECRDARELSSHSLDEELSPFEARRLERHLRGCASCRYRGAGLEAITNALRSAPLERPEVAVFPNPLRRDRGRVLRTGIPAAAVMVAASLCLILLQGSITGSGGKQTPVYSVSGVVSQSPITYALQPQPQQPSYPSIVWSSGQTGP